MRLGTASTYGGGGGASKTAAVQAPEGVKRKPRKPELPCFFAAARVCRGIQFVDEEGQLVKECPMLEQGQCRRSHDPRACRALWTYDAEFLHKLDVYEDLVRRNENRVPSKSQLQDAGIIPNWKKAAPQKPAKGDVGVQSLPQRSRLTVDPYRSVSVYAGSPRGSAGDRHGVMYMAVLDGNGTAVEGASYQSSSAGATPGGARIVTRETNAVSDDDGSSSDDYDLPMYPCTLCNEAMVLGGGGTLSCTEYRSGQVFGGGDSVALLGLRTNSDLNHRQGTIVGSCDGWCGVLLVGETEPIAVCPVNLRRIYTAVFGLPGFRDKP